MSDFFLTLCVFCFQFVLNECNRCTSSVVCIDSHCPAISDVCQLFWWPLCQCYLMVSPMCGCLSEVMCFVSKKKKKKKSFISLETPLKYAAPFECEESRRCCFFVFICFPGVRGCTGWVLAMGDCSVISLCFEYIRLRTWVRRLNKNFRGEEEVGGRTSWLDAVLWNRWHLKCIIAELITLQKCCHWAPPLPPRAHPTPLVNIYFTLDRCR